MLKGSSFITVVASCLCLESGVERRTMVYEFGQFSSLLKINFRQIFESSNGTRLVFHWLSFQHP